MTKPRRPSADKTRKKILDAAKMHFLQKGYEATYIKDIAESANINTNLIFHHFENKQMLWHTVKRNILEQQPGGPSYNLSSARTFFKSILDYVFNLYTQQPDLVRLIQWQQLADNQADLAGSGDYSPKDWLIPMRQFQQKGEIIKEVDAEHIMLFITFNTYAPFLQRIIPFDTTKLEKYKLMIYDICCETFIKNKPNNTGSLFH